MQSDSQTTPCPECGRDRGNREPHKPECSFGFVTKEPRDPTTSDVCPECGRDRGNREPHRPSCKTILPEPGAYRHYKGGYYLLAWLAKREHDGEWMCCYGEQGTLKRYVRPASEWFEEMSPGVRRFSPA